MPFTFGEDSFSPGDSTGVQCIVTKGDSPVQIGWLFNNETLKNGQNGVNIINISAKTSLLNIASINDMNRGVYVCQAKNLAGVAENGSELKVNGTQNNINLSEQQTYVYINFLQYIFYKYYFHPKKYENLTQNPT